MLMFVDFPLGLPSTRYWVLILQHFFIHKMPKICEICDISFKTFTGHSLHQEAKHSEVKPSCEKCGKEFSNRQNLKRHINGIHKGLEKNVEMSPVWQRIDLLSQKRTFDLLSKSH